MFPLEELARLTISFGLVVLIWLVQLVIYPSFRAMEAARLRAWHERYTVRVSLVVVPLMFAQAGLLALAWMQAPSAWLGAVTACVALAWAVTFLQSVPCHRQIATARDPEPAVRRLLRGNAVRTLAWSLAFGFDLIACLQESTKLSS